jgi:hypothetical protein
MANKAINEYRTAKEDILIKSNNLLTLLSNKRATEKSKIRNKSANVGSGGSNEDLRFYMDNSFDMEEAELLNTKDSNLKSLKDKSLATSSAKTTKKRKQEMDSAKNILSAFSKLF